MSHRLFICRICSGPCPRYAGPTLGWTCTQCIAHDAVIDDTTISGDLDMSKNRPMAYCAADGCDRRTRAASKQCSQHRTSAVPVITVNDAGFLDIHGVMHSPTEALELANKIADVLAGGRRGRH